MCAQLRRGEPSVRLHVLRAVPRALVLQLRQEARHSSVGNGSGEPTVPHHARHVQRLHHHTATRLGYRRRCLVMIVVPNINHPSMKSPSPGVQHLPPVRMGTLSVNVPAAGDGLVQSPQALLTAGQCLRILNSRAIRANRHRANTHVHADGRTGFHRRHLLAILDAETGDHAPAVRLTATSLIDPWKRSSSTIATRPIFGRITALPSTRTVSGPLSARNPCSCFRRLNLGNPTR